MPALLPWHVLLFVGHLRLGFFAHALIFHESTARVTVPPAASTRFLISCPVVPSDSDEHVSKARA